MGFLTPQASKPRRPPTRRPPPHTFHKVPSGHSPYVKAKQVQLIDRDPSKSISLFWAAINSGDRVDSALKDMAIVMKQLDRSDEAIEAIKSFRHLCPHESQEALDNILLELYKRSGRIKDQIKMLEIKVKSIEEGNDFGGKRIRPARSQGKKIYMTIEQEYSRLLGNLAWAYMQNNDFQYAEEHYKKALSLEPDKNKQCNLAICLMNMNRITEAKLLLHTIRAPTYENGVLVEEESYAKSLERATDMLTQLESNSYPKVAASGILSPFVMQTQPKRCSGLINGLDRKKYFLGEDRRCAPRKLAFGENIGGLTQNGVKKGEIAGKDKGDCFWTPKSNKSWADMVEEEESPLSFQTQPSKGFNDENLDFNIMDVAPLNERLHECYDCGNGIKVSRSSSKRLPVFRDITSSSESRHDI